MELPKIDLACCWLGVDLAWYELKESKLLFGNCDWILFGCVCSVPFIFNTIREIVAGVGESVGKKILD